MTIIRSEGRILFEEHDGEGAHVRAQLEESTMWKLKKILGEGYGKN